MLPHATLPAASKRFKVSAASTIPLIHISAASCMSQSPCFVSVHLALSFQSKFVQLTSDDDSLGKSF